MWLQKDESHSKIVHIHVSRIILVARFQNDILTDSWVGSSNFYLSKIVFKIVT